MITYSIQDIHKDIKYLLQPHAHKALWKPRYYKQLKEYILPDMMRLNKLCNQDGFRSFAVCVNDFMLQDAQGTPKFDIKKLDNFCQQNFDCPLEQAVKPNILKDTLNHLTSATNTNLGSVMCMKNINHAILFYKVSVFDFMQTLSTPYHEYGHLLDLKFNFFQNTQTYQGMAKATQIAYKRPHDPQAQEILRQYHQEFSMLKESFADCFAHSCLVLKEPENKALYRYCMYKMSRRLCRILQNKTPLYYCGFPATRTMLNRINLDHRCHNMKKYYHPDGSINFLKLAHTCAEVIRQQAYNHENFQTLRSAISKPSINLANLNPSQYEQWYYDYLDAQNCQKKYRPKNVYYDFFISLGETVLTTKNKKDFLSLLDKYPNSELQPFFNDYRKLITPQQTNVPQNTNLAQLIKNKSRT